MAVRDMAGLRIHAPRLAASVPAAPALWPGSVTVTDDEDVLRAKVCYTALQAHLGELVLQLVCSHGLDEARAWAAVRSIVDSTYTELGAEPRLSTRAAADHAFLTAPEVPHKALLRMRLAPGTGDLYVAVPNALVGAR
jgi:siderophore synthetase component